MTYNVFSGTLNLTQPSNQNLLLEKYMCQSAAPENLEVAERHSALL